MPLNYFRTSVFKRIVLLLFIIISSLVILKLSIFYMPFLVAFIIALIIEPLIKTLMIKLKLSRKFSSIIIFFLVFGTILGILIWGISTIISESTNLLKNFNDYFLKINNGIQQLIGRFNLDKINLPIETRQIIQDTLTSVLEQISAYLRNFLGNLIKFFTSIPNIAINFAITVLALYFICTDKIYMLDELEHHLPEKWVKEIIEHLRGITKTLGGFLKAQIILIIISFIISLIGLYIMDFAGLNVGFPLLIALTISFVDSLPILGSGAVMVPWAVISALNGDLTLGISIIVLLIIMSTTRQFIEPKIVSGNIGIHPIFTIISMYTGFKIIGVIGMLVGPILLIIFKNIFQDFIDDGLIKSIVEN